MNMERRPEMVRQEAFDAGIKRPRFVPKFTLGKNGGLIIEGESRRRSAPVAGTSNRKNRRR